MLAKASASHAVPLNESIDQQLDKASSEHAVDAPVAPEISAAVPDEAAPDLTAELLATTSASAIEASVAGPVEVSPMVDSGTAHSEPGSATDVEPAASLADAASATAGSIGSDQPEIEVAEQPMALAQPTISQDDELQPIGAPHRHEKREPPPSALLTFAQAASWMNRVTWEHMRAESEASVAYLQAVGQARTPFEMIDLQTREVIRALNAAIRFGQVLAAPAREIRPAA